MSVLFAIPVDLAYHLVCWLAAILPPSSRHRLVIALPVNRLSR